MKSPIVMIGVGEMGGVFARGLLRAGHPLFPVARDTALADAARESADPGGVLVAVGEGDLQAVLAEMPAAWRERLILLQNELLPHDWQRHGIESPTVISVWFEKKPGMDFKVIVPSPVHGPRAGLVRSALATLGIPSREVDEGRMLFELVLKNVYILTSNIAGLRVGGTVGELWSGHQDFARAVADEVMAIQFRLIGRELDREALIAGMVEAFEGDLQHRCTGRSAPARLSRAIEHADAAGLAVPVLRELWDAQLV